MTDTTGTPEARAAEFLKTMSLQDKVGLMFHTICPGNSLDAERAMVPELMTMRKLIEKGITHFNIHGSSPTAGEMAETNNELQRFATSVNSKVPITFSSDPRHAFSNNVAASMSAGCFSQWPESLGMVAIGDADRMREYCDIVRQEYVAIGLRAALHPQVDLATHYLWSRISGGMGESAELASKLVGGYIEGLQGESIGPDSVTACVKHFPGGAPQRDGFDCHFAWGVEQDYPGDNFDYHLQPFRAAVDAGVRAVMPSYGKPIGTKFPEVAFAFNKQVIDDVLRKDLGFDGIVLSDWLVIEGFENNSDDIFTAKAWGVEDLTVGERLVKALDAGVDQFGGDICVDALVDLVKQGEVPESRIDKSALLLLREKFALGLFDQPMVDPEVANRVVGKADFIAAGKRAQADSMTLIQNEMRTLPLNKGIKVYTEGFNDDQALSRFASKVDSPADADVIVIRLETPWTPMGNGAITRSFHHGSLEFTAEQQEHIAKLAKQAPVVVDLYCDRPAILGAIKDNAMAILCNFGVQEDVLAEILFGERGPRGKMPFDLPRSKEAIAEGRIDVPFDTKDPVFRFGQGLRYGE